MSQEINGIALVFILLEKREIALSYSFNSNIGNKFAVKLIFNLKKLAKEQKFNECSRIQKSNFNWTTTVFFISVFKLFTEMPNNRTDSFIFSWYNNSFAVSSKSALSEIK